jgi:hypothetical protein
MHIRQGTFYTRLMHSINMNSNKKFKTAIVSTTPCVFQMEKIDGHPEYGNNITLLLSIFTFSSFFE